MSGLDPAELGVAAENLYHGLRTVFDHPHWLEGSLSPYVPTLDRVAEALRGLLEALASRRGRQSVFYEPGCGAATVSSRISSWHVVCVELDPELAGIARANMEKNGNILGEVVVGDLSSFTLRRVDAIYSYLLPTANDILVSRHCCSGAVLASLDYPSLRLRGLEDAVIEAYPGRSLFIYKL